MNAPCGYVHRFVPSAATAARAPRTLLLLHGTGGDENDLLPLGPLLDRDAALLSPRGNVLENGMPRFFRRIREGVFDRADIVRRAGELSAFVNEARQAYELGPIVAVGFSNGANIAGAVLLVHPGVLAAAMLLSPMVPLVPDTPPDLNGTLVWIAAGRADPLVSTAEVERLMSLLRGSGAEVALEWHSGGHGIPPAVVTQGREWLAAHAGRLQSEPRG
jgi:predicted esterase